ncbi:hypothetical protein [Streptomyces spororaveus]|nr:hypothetical protein [Streptomyces spororaveus]
MTGLGSLDPEYAALVAGLAVFRSGRLQGRPSDRALAEAAGVSATTIGHWLRGNRFPQEIDPLLALVRAVRAEAAGAGLAGDSTAAAVLDAERWRRAYQDEARRRADATRGAVEAGQSRAVLERMRPGRLLSEVTDPFAFGLEVHRAIDTGPRSGGMPLPVLPAYVPRQHDQALAEVVAQAAAGENRIAVLVGGSSTGKTRACWEALHLLRERDEPWRLWHPIDPTRSGAALAELADLAPYTVVWLNEAQLYLEPDGDGEKVAAGLRALLRNPGRGPALVLATLWPDHWDTLTTRIHPDVHAQARELLDGHRITVPDAFTGRDLAALAETAGSDPRLGEAAELATDGQITQYLAGVPVLLDRYHNAPPATRALIHAAMDARRLGAGLRNSLAWLAKAAPGYLTDTEWDHTGDDWLKHALDYVTTPCNGIPGILSPVKTGTPRNQRNQRTTTGQGPLYRLADYLDQHGRRHRAETIPPIDFWTAAAEHAHPADLTALGNAAWRRGLYRDAAQLHKHATTHGNPRAAAELVIRFHALHPTDHRPAHHAAAYVADDPYLAWLLDVMRDPGAQEQAAAWLVRNPAVRVSLDYPDSAAQLLNAMREAGAQKQAVALAKWAAARVSLNYPDSAVKLLNAMREAGAQEPALALAERAATRVSLDYPDSAAQLLNAMREAGAQKQAVALAERAAACVSLDYPHAVAELLEAMRRAGAQEPAVALAERAAAHDFPRDPHAVALLLNAMREAGAQESAVVLAERAAACVSLDYPHAVAELLEAMRRAGAQEPAVALAERAAAHDFPRDPHAVALLLNATREAGVLEQAVVLAERAATDVSLDNACAVAVLLEAMRRAGVLEQAVVLAERAATDVSLDNACAVAELLEAMRRAGAQEPAVALAERAATDVSLDNPRAVAQLLKTMWTAGGWKSAVALAERATAHVSLDEWYAVAQLLEAMRTAGGRKSAVALAERATARVSLYTPIAVAALLDAMREAWMLEQAVALAERATVHVSLDNPYTAARLLEAMRKAGAQEQVVAFAERLPATGCFDVFIGVGNHEKQFRFGREPDGSAAVPWTWDDLE